MPSESTTYPGTSPRYIRPPHIRQADRQGGHLHVVVAAQGISLPGYVSGLSSSWPVYKPADVNYGHPDRAPADHLCYAYVWIICTRGLGDRAKLTRHQALADSVPARACPRPRACTIPRYERDACGVGFVCHIDGRPSHDIIEQRHRRPQEPAPPGRGRRRRSRRRRGPHGPDTRPLLPRESAARSASRSPRPAATASA